MAANQFAVFGVDVRDLGRLWQAAWSDFLFGDDSPIRNLLESSVCLIHPDGSKEALQAGKAAAAPAQCESQALALPDDYVLARELELPDVAETDLASALELEVAASSPFAADDTVAGWRVRRLAGSAGLSVKLVIASRTSVVGWLGAQADQNIPEGTEVWAHCGDEWVIVRGFGEVARETGYRHRLLRTGAMVIVTALLLVLCAAASTFFKSRELAVLNSIRIEATEASSNAVTLRDELAQVNATITKLNELTMELPSPQLELSRLTALLPDQAFVTQYTQNGRKIRIRGRAKEAAALQQALTDEPVFDAVVASQAISKFGNTGLEQFSLDLTLRARRDG